MKLLQVSLRSLLLYSLLVVLIITPLSLYFINRILKQEVDASLQVQTEQFLKHIRGFEYLEDLEMDLAVLDKLSRNMSIKPLVDNNTAKETFQTIRVYDSIDHDYHPFRKLSTRVDIKNKPYLLTVQVSLVASNDLVVAIGTVETILIILLVGGLWLIKRSISQRLWRPFYKTLDQLKAYQIDKNETFQADETTIDEFQDLNSTVKYLTDRNRNLYLQQKEFIENAAHELQTPIAVFQSKLDNLMQSSALQEEEAAIISGLEDTARRMARLNKNLLLLSKIDNNQFTNTENIDISTLIPALIKNIYDVAEAENITIKTQLKPLVIQADKTLIEILLTNLLHNAIRHNHRDGNVTIQIEGYCLEISNTGKPLKIDPEKMFDRFIKGGGTQNSIGLGLAIVKKICILCGFQISYRYDQQHIMTLVFK